MVIRMVDIGRTWGPATLSPVTHRARTVLGSALLSLVALAGPFVPLAAQAAAAAAPAASPSASPSAAGSPSAPGSPAAPGSPVPGSTCAIGDLVSIAVPTPSPLPTHDPGVPTIGGELLAGNGLSVPIASPPLPTMVAATSWLVADLDSGAVLGACGAHRYAAPASVQKLLLVATALPKLKPTDVTTITAEDLNFEPGSSAVGLMRGGTYTVEDLFLGLMLNSGNDAANTLARLAGGDRGVPGGLAEMNAEARRLGAWDTHAETPSGLDGPGQVTSVYDLALIFRACFGHENFRRYIKTETARMPAQPPKDPDGFAIQNDNRLLYEYPGALGGKTGFTDIARHTFVGAAERNGRRLVVAVLGAEIRPLRAWQQTASLLDWGFAVARDASVGHLVAPGEAEKLMARPPSATPQISTAQSAVDPSPSQSPPAIVLVLIGAGLAAFGSACVIAVRLSGRRRAGHRGWRADDRAPVLVGATAAQAEAHHPEPEPATATPAAAPPPAPPPDTPPSPPEAPPLMGQPTA
jgi:serine-type D-Ala-D-Ala carboxypeptidase (penicillin-binding protein 5/6)